MREAKNNRSHKSAVTISAQNNRATYRGLNRRRVGQLLSSVSMTEKTNSICQRPMAVINSDVQWWTASVGPTRKSKAM